MIEEIVDDNAQKGTCSDKKHHRDKKIRYLMKQSTNCSNFLEIA